MSPTHLATPSSCSTGVMDLDNDLAHQIPHPGKHIMHNMLIRDFPNELILIIGAHLDAHDLYHLILVGRRFSLLLSRLRSFAIQPEHAQAALYWAVLSNNRDLARHVLGKAEGKVILYRRHEDNRDVEENRINEISRPRNNIRKKPVLFRAPGELTDKVLDEVMNQREKFLPVIAPKRDCERRPIEWAIQKDHYALLRLALSTDNTINALLCSEALVFAASCGKNMAINVILEWACASLEKQEYRKTLNMAFFKVVEEGLEKAIGFFLGKGAEVDIRNADGKSLLAVAARNSSHRVVKILVENGASVNVEDAAWHSPLYMALTRYPTIEGEEIVRLLRAHNAELNIQERGGGVSLGLVEGVRRL